MRITYLTIAGLLLMFALAATSPAAWTLSGIVPQPEYALAGKDPYPWRQLGILHGDGKRCTATLVGPDIVLTAAHCIKAHVPIRSYEFLAGWDGYQALARTKVLKVVSMGDYDNTGPHESNLYRQDWVLLQLQDGIGLYLGYLPIAPALQESDFLYLLGYPKQSGPIRLHVSMGCRVIDMPWYIHPDVDATPTDCVQARGTSGGPVLKFSGNRGWEVKGVYSSASPLKDIGVFVPSSTIPERLQGVRLAGDMP